MLGVGLWKAYKDTWIGGETAVSAVAIRKAVGGVFETAWGSTTPVAWPNQKYTPVQGVHWVRFSIAQGDARKVELGATKVTHRFTGIVFISVFAPLDSGDEQARIYCDQAAAIFRNTSIPVGVDGRVLMRVPDIRDAGSDSLFQQFNVATPYQYDTLL